MNDIVLLNDEANDVSNNLTAPRMEIDNLFENLTGDIASINKLINNINTQKKANLEEECSLLEEKQKLNKSRDDFEKYVRGQNEEISKKISQVND